MHHVQEIDTKFRQGATEMTRQKWVMQTLDFLKTHLEQDIMKKEWFKAKHTISSPIQASQLELKPDVSDIQCNLDTSITSMSGYFMQ